MYIFFVDATDTRWLDNLNKKKIPHAGRIVKVFVSKTNPRTLSGKKDLFYIPKDGKYDPSIAAFRERLLARGFNDTTVAYPLTLFEFSKKMGFLAHFIMAKGYDKDPLDHLHGYKRAKTDPWRIHIDVFTQEGISKLRRVLDIDNPEMVLTQREVIGSVFREEEYLYEPRGEVLI